MCYFQYNIYNIVCIMLVEVLNYYSILYDNIIIISKLKYTTIAF